MKTLKFKTNINCGGCIVSVTPVLNKLVGDKNWQVDTTNADNVLRVQSDTAVADEIIAGLKNVGYNAVELA